MVKNLPANAGDASLIPGSGRSLKEEMAAHCGVLAWEISMDRGAGSPRGRKESDIVTKQQQQMKFQFGPALL